MERRRITQKGNYILKITSCRSLFVDTDFLTIFNLDNLERSRLIHKTYFHYESRDVYNYNTKTKLDTQFRLNKGQNSCRYLGI